MSYGDKRCVLSGPSGGWSGVASHSSALVGPLKSLCGVLFANRISVAFLAN